MGRRSIVHFILKPFPVFKSRKSLFGMAMAVSLIPEVSIAHVRVYQQFSFFIYWKIVAFGFNYDRAMCFAMSPMDSYSFLQQNLMMSET